MASLRVSVATGLPSQCKLLLPSERLRKHDQLMLPLFLFSITESLTFDALMINWTVTVEETRSCYAPWPFKRQWLTMVPPDLTSKTL
jgi:hypothetical protein